MTIEKRRTRVNKFLARRVDRVLGSLNEFVRDPRSSRGRKQEQRRKLAPMLHALFAGMLACDKGLRDVEERSEELELMDGDVPVGRIPSTTPWPRRSLFKLIANVLPALVLKWPQSAKSLPLPAT